MPSRVRPVSPVLPQPHSLGFLCCQAALRWPPLLPCAWTQATTPVGRSQGLFVRAAHSSQETGGGCTAPAWVVNTQDPLPTAVQSSAEQSPLSGSWSPVTEGAAQLPFCMGAFSRQPAT